MIARLASFLVVACLLFVVVTVGCGTAQGGGVPMTGDRGERFFLMKCNGCHPNGGQGAGPAIDVSLVGDVLERGKSAGRHAVPEYEYEPLVAYIQTRFGAPTTTAAAVPAPATALTSPVVPGAPALANAVAAPAVAVATSVAGGGDPARGAAYFQAKCSRCHPGGGAGVGPAVVGKPVPGVLQRSASAGRHNVNPDEFDHLVAYMLTLGAVAGAVPPPTATPVVPVVAPVPSSAPPSTTTTTPAATSTNTGMVDCPCTCRCPAGAPPAAIPAACVCKCQCPR